MQKSREELIMLYDIYYELLTGKQRDYFSAYYFQDLSLSEIADEFKISRNAVHDQIRKVCQILVNYEDKLAIYRKNKKIIEVLEEASTDIKEKIQKIIEE